MATSTLVISPQLVHSDDSQEPAPRMLNMLDGHQVHRGTVSVSIDVFLRYNRILTQASASSKNRRATQSVVLNVSHALDVMSHSRHNNYVTDKYPRSLESEHFRLLQHSYP